jgi:flagellar biosynthesis GTPase FlhF
VQASETGDPNVVSGSYRVALPDGRTQVVTYEVHLRDGYRAQVRYEGAARYPDPPPALAAVRSPPSYSPADQIKFKRQLHKADLLQAGSSAASPPVSAAAAKVVKSDDGWRQTKKIGYKVVTPIPVVNFAAAADVTSTAAAAAADLTAEPSELAIFTPSPSISSSSSSLSSSLSPLSSSSSSSVLPLTGISTLRRIDDFVVPNTDEPLPEPTPAVAEAAAAGTTATTTRRRQRQHGAAWDQCGDLASCLAAAAATASEQQLSLTAAAVTTAPPAEIFDEIYATEPAPVSPSGSQPTAQLLPTTPTISLAPSTSQGPDGSLAPASTVQPLGSPILLGGPSPSVWPLATSYSPVLYRSEVLGHSFQQSPAFSPPLTAADGLAAAQPGLRIIPLSPSGPYLPPPPPQPEVSPVIYLPKLVARYPLTAPAAIYSPQSIVNSAYVPAANGISLNSITPLPGAEERPIYYYDKVNPYEFPVREKHSPAAKEERSSDEEADEFAEEYPFGSRLVSPTGNGLNSLPQEAAKKQQLGWGQAEVWSGATAAGQHPQLSSSQVQVRIRDAVAPAEAHLGERRHKLLQQQEIERHKQQQLQQEQQQQEQQLLKQYQGEQQQLLQQHQEEQQQLQKLQQEKQQQQEQEEQQQLQKRQQEEQQQQEQEEQQQQQKLQQEEQHQLQQQQQEQQQLQQQQEQLADAIDLLYSTADAIDQNTIQTNVVAVTTSPPPTILEGWTETLSPYYTTTASTTATTATAETTGTAEQLPTTTQPMRPVHSSDRVRLIYRGEKFVPEFSLVHV